MSKVKKFAAVNVRKISGGKDPLRVVEEFILRRGFNPEQCEKEKNSESCRWMLRVGEDEELEVLLEGLKRTAETTIYMGINIATVPLRGAHDVLVAALEIADGLIGIKVSLVGHYLVLSSSMGASGISAEDLDYTYKLISAQQAWFREALADELGWEELPAD
jgi:hypothetical protein